MNMQSISRKIIAVLLPVVLAAIGIGNVQANTQNVTAMETVRNGGFEYGKKSWNRSDVIIHEIDEGNPGKAMIIQPPGTTDGVGSVIQLIHLPTTISASHFSYNYRLEVSSSSSNPRFSSLSVALYASGANAPPIAVLHNVGYAQLPIDWQNWQTISWDLTPDDITALQNAHAAGQLPYMAIVIQAVGVSAVVDNVSLTVDGTINYPEVGEIAFLGENSTNARPTVNRIKPDGSEQQTLWIHPDTITPSIYDVAWKPDASEIAFISNHEGGYSPFHSDIYGIDPTGGNLRRISNAPMHSTWPNGHATGTITGKIHNAGLSYGPDSSLIYIQGAKKPVIVSIPSKGNEVSFTVTDVEDLGVGVNQYAIFSWSGSGTGWSCANGKEYHAAVGDVQAGTTVDVGTINFDGLCNHYNPRSISWKHDGSAIGFFIGISTESKKVNSTGDGVGNTLFTEASDSKYSTDLAWSPVDDRILYTNRSLSSLNDFIAIASENGQGAWVDNRDTQATSDNPVWLPDGTGFLFTSNKNSIYNDAQLIGRYNLQNNQYQYIYTLYGGERIDNLSLSPDGKYLVFERALGDGGSNLWIMNVDKPSEQWQLTNDGHSRNPDWSRQNPVVPAYTVTPNIGNGGSVIPNTAQSAATGTTKSFVVTPHSGYTRISVVKGNCPAGNWSGNTYTTGLIIGSCNVEFSFLCEACLPSVGGWRSAIL
ncbi:hypothetical protein TI04_08335 [Achromatium sp. WMS2]|nr:hypothetical protein TI04_08335 [Achromatium sp. WMS2]